MTLSDTVAGSGRHVSNVYDEDGAAPEPEAPQWKAEDILNEEQLEEYNRDFPVTDIEEGACQIGDVAVRGLLMSQYMSKLVILYGLANLRMLTRSVCAELSVSPT